MRGRARARSRRRAGCGAHPGLDALGAVQTGTVGGPGGGDVLQDGAPRRVPSSQVGQPDQKVRRPPGAQRLPVHVPEDARHGLSHPAACGFRLPGSR